LEERLLTFGGFSFRDGIRGAWEHESRIHRDESRQFEVALASWRQVPDWLELVFWVRQSFRQVALYVVVAGIPEVLA
jgi:hypothetical protein